MTLKLSGSGGIDLSGLTLTANSVSANVLSVSGTTTGSSATYSGSVSVPNTFGFKNRIINGAMMIDQRNAGASQTIANAGFAVDRFQYYASQASKFTAQQTPSATETGYATRVGAGFINYMALTTAAAVSVGASDYFNIRQKIEGLNISDLAWGTANAKAVTLSAWVYSSLTGTFGGAILNGAENRSYPFSYSIPVANTWTQISVTIPGDTSGTWLTTIGVGMEVVFNLGAGSTYSGSAGSWSGSAYFSTIGAISVVGTLGAKFYITGVQLEVGSAATSFDYRDYTRELQLCQRYYEICSGTYYNANAVVNYFGTAVSFAVTKRNQPTIALIATQASSGVNANPGVYGEAQSIYGFRVMALSTVAGTMAFQATLSATAEM